MDKEIDQLVVSTLKSNKEKGFGLIMHHYKEPLYWHIRKMVILHDDADDVLQNVFMKVWKGLHNFRGDAAIYTWLYRIATNEIFTFLAQKRKRSISSITDIEEGFMDNIKSDTFFEGDKAQELLQKAILNLPEKQRLVFNMRYFDEVKYEEMSDILNTSVGALKASYHHAAKKVELFLKEEL